MTRPNTHRCPWPSCGEFVGAHLWGCKAHWHRLPRVLRNRIYNAYRTGQSMATASDEYRAATDLADRWIAGEVAVEADAARYALGRRP